MVSGWGSGEWVGQWAGNTISLHSLKVRKGIKTRYPVIVSNCTQAGVMVARVAETLR